LFIDLKVKIGRVSSTIHTQIYFASWSKSYFLNVGLLGLSNQMMNSWNPLLVEIFFGPVNFYLNKI